MYLLLFKLCFVFWNISAFKYQITCLIQREQHNKEYVLKCSKRPFFDILKMITLVEDDDDDDNKILGKNNVLHLFQFVIFYFFF